MIVGSDASFGMYFEFVDPVDKWMYGRAQYLIHRNMVGNRSIVQSLTDVLIELISIYRGHGKRRDVDLYQLDTNALVRVLFGTLYLFDEGHPDLYLGRGEGQDWSPYMVSPTTPGFCDEMVFLVEGDKHGRIITFGPESGRISEGKIDTGEFDRVLAQAITFLTDHLIETTGSTNGLI